MPTSTEEPLRPPLAASSPMKGSLWALLRLISRVYCGKAASESEQTGPYGAAIRPLSELRTSGTPASAVRSGNRPAPPDDRHLTGQKGFGRPLRGGHKAAKTNHEPLATSHEPLATNIKTASGSGCGSFRGGPGCRSWPGWRRIA